MRKFVGIGEAAKILNRSLNGTRRLVYKHRVEVKRVRVGKRLVYRYCATQLAAVAPTLGPRHFGKRQFRRAVKQKSTGYMMVYLPQHPRAMCGGYVYEHWLIAEQKLGRYLKKEEQVHHINRVRDDNRPENLHVYANSSDHFRLAHAEWRESLKKFHGPSPDSPDQPQPALQAGQGVTDRGH